MKSLFHFPLILFFACAVCFGMDKTHKPQDSTGAVPDSLRKHYPFLWHKVRRSSDLRRRPDTLVVQPRKQFIDSIVSARIVRMTGGNAKKAREMDNQIHHEEMYMQEKPNMDIARGKFVINPYLTNCFYLDRIDDPSPDLLPRKKRFAIKWQVSVQMPVITAKYSNTGLFCAFTNRALFDITNDLDSRPVTHKTFMPEVLGRLDFSQFLRRLGTDQLVLQAGAQHESNGGVDDTLSLIDSRGIRARLYIQPIVRFMRITPDSTGRYLCSDKYHLMMNARLFYPYGTWDNKNIATYIGYLDLNASYESAPVVPLFGYQVPLGVFKVEGSFSPGGSVSPMYTSFSIDVSWTPPMISNRRVYYRCLPKVPLTPYFRFFSGYNEFLNTYDRRTVVVAFGIRLRS